MCPNEPRDALTTKLPGSIEAMEPKMEMTTPILGAAMFASCPSRISAKGSKAI
jgi:hypothetical protein